MSALNFGAMMKKKRSKQGWSMAALADKLQQEHGIATSRSAVSLWENNKAIPRMQTLRALMEVYDMTPMERLLAYEVVGQ